MRRALLSLAAASVAIVAVVAGSMLFSGDNEEDVRAGTGRPVESSLPRYRGPALSVPGTAVGTADSAETGTEPTQAGAESPSAAVTTSAPSSSTSAPLECRNSFDPACGEFYFSPPPPGNQPAMIEVSFEPSSPVAGEAVVVTLRGTDPDATSGYTGFVSTCRSDTYQCAPPPAAFTPDRDCRAPHGAWDTPAPPQQPLVLTRSFTVFFDQPGDHEFYARIETAGPLPEAWAGTDLCDEKNLYGSASFIEGAISVAPSPTTDPTLLEQPPTSEPGSARTPNS